MANWFYSADGKRGINLDYVTGFLITEDHHGVTWLNLGIVDHKEPSLYRLQEEGEAILNQLRKVHPGTTLPPAGESASREQPQ